MGRLRPFWSSQLSLGGLFSSMGTNIAALLAEGSVPTITLILWAQSD